MNRSIVPYFFLGFAAILAVTAVALLIIRPGVPRDLPAEQPTVPMVEPVVMPEDPEDGPDAEAVDIEPAPPEILGQRLVAADPAELVNRIADAIQNGDFQGLAHLLGGENLDEATRAGLERLALTTPRLRQPNGIREIGELELNRRARWALELADREVGRDRIFLDLERTEDGWMVDRIVLPPEAGQSVPRAVIADSLGVADAFLQTVLRQDFEFARDFVDPETVSDAKIAGLCILFEEGDYALRESRPLRKLFERGDTVGYLANVTAPDGSQAAQFGLTLREPADGGQWRVTEINLDQLLADYAVRVAGGDVYYSPFVRNPGGGDTIALYFEFDDDGLTPRAQRQLEIVASVLRSDPGRRLTLSGHTDALGSQDYNDALSARRATIVRDFLSSNGVDSEQIATLAKGASQPRRPNVTESGDDDPDGRRANRRTEIYLDF
jgi:outer membrane protein OmpA-like peptidoglycan-associated protein